MGDICEIFKLPERLNLLSVLCVDVVHLLS